MKRNPKVKKVTILAEDEATYKLVNGFVSNAVACDRSKCLPLHYTNGWNNCVEIVKAMRLDVQVEDYVILVIDYDKWDTDRYDHIKEQLSGLPFNERVFLLGSKIEAEELLEPMRAHFGISDLKLEGIGFQIAQECYDGRTPSAWETEALDVNYDVIWRLEKYVKPFLFKPNAKPSL